MIGPIPAWQQAQLATTRAERLAAAPHNGPLVDTLLEQIAAVAATAYAMVDNQIDHGERLDPAIVHELQVAARQMTRQLMDHLVYLATPSNATTAGPLPGGLRLPICTDAASHGT